MFFRSIFLNLYFVISIACFAQLYFYLHMLGWSYTVLWGPSAPPQLFISNTYQCIYSEKSKGDAPTNMREQLNYMDYSGRFIFFSFSKSSSHSVSPFLCRVMSYKQVIYSSFLIFFYCQRLLSSSFKTSNDCFTFLLFSIFLIS